MDGRELHELQQHFPSFVSCFSQLSYPSTQLVECVRHLQGAGCGEAGEAQSKGPRTQFATCGCPPFLPLALHRTYRTALCTAAFAATPESDSIELGGGLGTGGALVPTVGAAGLGAEQQQASRLASRSQTAAPEPAHQWEANGATAGLPEQRPSPLPAPVSPQRGQPGSPTVGRQLPGQLQQQLLLLGDSIPSESGIHMVPATLLDSLALAPAMEGLPGPGLGAGLGLGLDGTLLPATFLDPGMAIVVPATLLDETEAAMLHYGHGRGALAAAAAAAAEPSGYPATDPAAYAGGPAGPPPLASALMDGGGRQPYRPAAASPQLSGDASRSPGFRTPLSVAATPTQTSPVGEEEVGVKHGIEAEAALPRHSGLGADAGAPPVPQAAAAPGGRMVLGEGAAQPLAGANVGRQDAGVEEGGRGERAAAPPVPAVCDAGQQRDALAFALAAPPADGGARFDYQLDAAPTRKLLPAGVSRGCCLEARRWRGRAHPAASPGCFCPWCRGLAAAQPRHPPTHAQATHLLCRCPVLCRHAPAQAWHPSRPHSAGAVAAAAAAAARPRSSPRGGSGRCHAAACWRWRAGASC